jgi:hypothetical protein
MTDVRPLEVSCGASTCTTPVPKEKQRHAFSSPTLALPGLGGACTACDRDDLVDWERLHQRDPDDLHHVVVELRKELIRDNYWGEPLPARIINNAARRGSSKLKVSASLNLLDKLRVGHPREGGQTHFAYHPKATLIHCGQHATGTCCRACLEKWYGIPRHLPLGKRELAFCSALLNLYTDVRLAEPEHVLQEAV